MPPRCSFSIIIPVLHESKIINTLLDSLDRLKRDEPFEIIVVDGSPTQDTLQVISKKNVMKYVSPQGRGRQMNEGAAHSTGDILIFLHADTFLPSNALTLIQTTLADQRYVGGAFALGIQSQNPLLKMIASFSTLRSRLTRAPYGDQVIFLRKSYFDAIGGYRDIPLMEDVELMRRVKKKDGEIIILSTSVITSDRRWNQEGLLYTTVRDLIIIFLYWCGIPAEKLVKFYPWQKE
ncbi:MAG TPA: TIGR04283 family arsenosugar biosynthesis glycosyltransferase [Candidatus Thermoplasmatota archaeon]|nr:TIGR04283 family arsenosugar biosynthesis glycosyltransferase [Candidatus Thermoplasmatota archaeon]